MILAEAHINDLVDTIEYQLKQMATAEDLIEAYHQFQPSPIGYFNDQIGRLRAILDAHIEPQTPTVS